MDVMFSPCGRAFLRADARGQRGMQPSRRLLHVSAVVIAFAWRFGVINCQWLLPFFHLQLSAMDVSVRTTMKGAAKCDKHCELQNSVNRQKLERILCFWVIPGSMPASVPMLYSSNSSAISALLL